MNNSSRALIIAVGAVIILLAMSACPWEKWTGGRLKNYHLLSDLFPPEMAAEAARSEAGDNIDPELLSYVEESVETPPADSVPVPVVTVVHDTLKTIVAMPHPETLVEDGVVLIEDYSPESSALRSLKQALSEAGSRNVRIAMVGDSYIEGDILAQDIRHGLQNLYGGRGVGYVPAFTNFPGFRGSVSQTCKHWKESEIRKMAQDDPLRTILGTYHEAEDGATVRLKGTKKPALVDSWQRSRIIYQSKQSGTLSVKFADSDTTLTYEVTPSSGIQCISVDIPTSDVAFKFNAPGTKVLGIWLESPTGIVLDDISLRGNSGVSHRTLNAITTAALRRDVDYDLIILEFGMNALSAAQKDYTAYARGMEAVIDNLRTLYPKAQILVMGVGDRGARVGTSLGSMATVKALVDAQRNMAARTGVMFYDTRAAMGGEGSAVKWNERRLVNSDYVHLNHAGGAALGKIFIESLQKSLK